MQSVPRTKLVILNSPSNPTGGVTTQADLERIGLRSNAREPGSSRTKSTASWSTKAKRPQLQRSPGYAIVR